jgi:hypothetical protein
MQVTNIIRGDPTIVSRYLADQLTDAERRAFEQHLIDDPEAVMELEATARFKVGLQRLREIGKLDSLVRATPLASQLWVRALAASIVVAVLAVGFSQRSTQHSRPFLAASIAALVDHAGRAVPTGATYAVLRTRMTNDDAVIELPASPEAIAIRVLPETPAQPPRYRVSLALVRADGTLEPVATIGRLQPAADGFVTVFADASALIPGHYQLAVSADTSGLPAADTFVIRTVARLQR